MADDSKLVPNVDVRDATHVKLPGGAIERIASKKGIDGRRLAPPSEGGFSVTTESGREVSMWAAKGYLREEK